VAGEEIVVEVGCRSYSGVDFLAVDTPAPADAPQRADATLALAAHLRGDEAGVERLLVSIYDNLIALAGRYLRDERGYQTLEPPALVHEAYLRLIDIQRVDWRGKSHFFAMAARQMRRILVERARAAAALKRGGRPARVTLHTDIPSADEPVLDVLAVEEALDRLARASPRQARVVELRIYAGMQTSEIAHVLGVSERTVTGDWRVGRAWLAAELEAIGGGLP
jgi:RNA polymerase sigma factor (TIGR02999 family)